MGIVSYAQNFEDVILWRALANIDVGCYVDIGAQHPIVDSVSKAFYEKGWRGVHVEPVAEFADLLRKDRPDETVIQAAVSERSEVIPFFEIPGSGLSTARRDIAEEQKAMLGCPIIETTITSVTLDDVLGVPSSENIHWLKIDVEGFEKEVLAGWRKSQRRPWVVVIEATHPNTTIDTFELWEDLLLCKGYELVYQDGLNRFYLHEQRIELREKFRFPPNVFDGFQLSGTSTSLTTHLKDRHARKVDEVLTQKRESEAKVAALQKDVRDLRDADESRESAHAEVLAALHREAQAREERLKDSARIELDGARRELAESKNSLEALRLDNSMRERMFDSLAERITEEYRIKSEFHLKEFLEREGIHAEKLASMQVVSQAREDSLRERARAKVETIHQQLAIAREDFAVAFAKSETDKLAAIARADRMAAAAQQRFDDLQVRLFNREATQSLQLTEFRKAANARQEALKARHIDEVNALRQELAEAAQQVRRIQQEAQSHERALAENAQRDSKNARDKIEALHKEMLHREMAFADKFAAEHAATLSREKDIRTEFEAQIDALKCDAVAREEATVRGHQERERHLQSTYDHVVRELAARDEIIRKINLKLGVVTSSWTWRMTSLFKSRKHFELLEGGDTKIRESSEENTIRHDDARDPSESTLGRLSRQGLIFESGKKSILIDMLGSPVQAFIQLAYRHVLGREADAAGAAHYQSRLAKGFGRASVLLALANSPEGKRHLSHEDLQGMADGAFVDAVFRRLLGRSPAPAESDYYLKVLAGGRDRQVVMREIEISPESQAYDGEVKRFKRDLAELVSREKAGRGLFGWSHRLQLLKTENTALELALEHLEENLRIAQESKIAATTTVTDSAISPSLPVPPEPIATAAPMVPDMPREVFGEALTLCGEGMNNANRSPLEAAFWDYVVSVAPD